MSRRSTMSDMTATTTPAQASTRAFDTGLFQAILALGAFMLVFSGPFAESRDRIAALWDGAALGPVPEAPLFGWEIVLFVGGLLPLLAVALALYTRRLVPVICAALLLQPAVSVGLHLHQNKAQISTALHDMARTHVLARCNTNPGALDRRYRSMCPE